MRMRFAALGRLFRSRGAKSFMMSNRSYVITPSKISESNQGPVVFLFGWANSKFQHLAKYSTIYENMGMTTIRYTAPMYFDGVPGPNLHRPLYPAFEEVNAAERDIILHLFSLNGCVMLTSLWQVLDETQNGRKIKEQIKGIVFDSCPAYPNIWGGTKVYAQATAPGEAASLQMLRRAYLFGTIALERTSTYLQSFWDSKIYESTSLYYRMLSYTGYDMPKNQLYLYSKVDFLCDYETIDKFREEQTKRGNNVDYIRFEDSPHVEHGRKYPQQYQNALSAFCEKSLAKVDDSFKQIQLSSKL